MTGAVEATGGTTFKRLSVFNAHSFQAIGISELLAGTPDTLTEQNLGCLISRKEPNIIWPKLDGTKPPGTIEDCYKRVTF